MVKIKMTIGNEHQISAVMASVAKVIDKKQLNMQDMSNIADVYTILNNMRKAVEAKRREAGG